MPSVNFDLCERQPSTPRELWLFCRGCLRQELQTLNLQKEIKMKKSPLASKTIWWNVLTVVAGVIAYLAGSEVIVENWAAAIPVLAAVQGAVNIALRFMTTKPLG